MDMLRIINLIANQSDKNGYVSYKKLNDLNLDINPVIKERLREMVNKRMGWSRRFDAFSLRFIKRMGHKPDPDGTVIDWQTMETYKLPDQLDRLFHTRHEYRPPNQSYMLNHRLHLHKKRIRRFNPSSTYARIRSTKAKILGEALKYAIDPPKAVFINEHTTPKYVDDFYIHMDVPDKNMITITLNTKYLCLRAKPLEDNVYQVWLLKKYKTKASSSWPNKSEIEVKYAYLDHNVVGFGRTIAAAKSGCTQKIKHTIAKELKNETI
jgi:hypothetical protein